jgi:hypothetical protein
MLDVLNLPKPQNGYIDYFFGDAATAATSWRTWEKPRGISMIHITCFGGGAGGGGGTTTNQAGGGGGGSGGQTTLLILAHVLPDILYVSPGKGGDGTTVFGGTGGSGTASYVSIAPSTAAIYLACFANGGSGSTFGGGNAGAVATQSSALMSSQGFFFALAGQTGTSAANAVVYPTTGLLVSGGAAGGPGGSFTANGFGGNITAPTQASIRFFSNVPGSADGTGIPGSNGISLFQPLLSTGGAGGGGQGATGIALNGSGGNGGFGSGGGGCGNAGGFINAGTSGGKGGDGLVIIQCF